MKQWKALLGTVWPLIKLLIKGRTKQLSEKREKWVMRQAEEIATYLDDDSPLWVEDIREGLSAQAEWIKAGCKKKRRR